MPTHKILEPLSAEENRALLISSRVWFQDYYGTNYKYATLTIGVPVDQFEAALRRIRALAVRVQDDNASGEDVTSQYVDLQSQLGNLEATRDRIRADFFLARPAPPRLPARASTLFAHVFAR